MFRRHPRSFIQKYCASHQPTYFYLGSNLGRYANFLINCAMDFHRKFLAYFYALALSLWSVAMPVTASPLSPGGFQELPTEKVSAFDQSGPVCLLSQNVSYQTHSFRTDGDSHDIHFFNEGNFQLVFLKNVFSTAYA